MEIQATPSFFKQLYQFDTVYYPQQVDNFVVWIVVDYPQEDIMPAATWEFLEKILGALRLRRQDVCISNVGKADWKDYSQAAAISYRFMWVFGAKVPNLPALAPYEPQIIAETPCLLADTLETLQQNLELKKKFWGILQKMFS